MLTLLIIKNFVLIESLEIKFKSGMTVITGETGAGKSLLIDTLGLVLGDRIDAKMIGNYSERCEISAVFNIEHIQHGKEWLQDNDLINFDDPSLCVITRQFTKDGRSRCNINGVVSTLNNVKIIGNYLVDIHGQHEHHSLLKPETQRELLDSYAGQTHLNNLTKLQHLYQSWHKNDNQLQQLKMQIEEQNSKQQFLQYQLQEFMNLNFTLNELENLKNEHIYLNNIEKIIREGQCILQLTSENEQTNILDFLNNGHHALSKIQQYDQINLNNIIQNWETATINLTESVNELQHYLNKIELDQERLTFVEERLQNIHNLARKHKTTPEELPQIQNLIKQQLDNVQTLQLQIQTLEQTVANLFIEYQTLAQHISEQRKITAKKLNQLVTNKMHELNMNNGNFAINVQQLPHEKFTQYGLDYIEYFVSANIGHSLQPLAKVVSGGELSRISLALQVILAENTTTNTIIFDEVDVGIGGKTAEIVGKLLQQLSSHNQIICITHLPQIASCGNNHLQISKNSDITNQTTYVTLQELTTNERINEIARMLGGINITQLTLEHAKEMLLKH